MNDSETYEYESRRYINPTLSSGEQMGFIDELRDTIGTNTAQINAQTQALGTDISPNYGGLTGSNNYFAQRYQTTPVQAQAATLKATAQAKALNDLMANYQTQAQNRYNQAYRNYQKRQNTLTTDPTSQTDTPYTKDPLENGNGNNTTGTANGGLTVVDDGSGGTSAVDSEGHGVKYDGSGHVISTSNPNYVQADNGYYYDIRGVDAPFSIQIRMPSTEMLNRWKANQKAHSKGDM